MKTTPLFLLLLCLWLVSCKDEGAPTPSIIESPKPTGTRLQSVKVYMVPLKHGRPDLLRKIEWEHETYTPEGFVESRQFRPDYSLDLAYNNPRNEMNTYDKGVLKEKVEINRGAYRRNVYTYTNTLISLRDAYNDPEDRNGPLEKYIYEYAGGDKPSKIHFFWGSYNGDPASGDTLSTQMYTYDSRGNIITDRTIFSTGKEVTYFFEYDHYNNMTKKSTTSTDHPTPIVQQIVEYKYDSNGRMSEREHSTLGESNFQKYIHHFDEDNRITSIDVYEEIRAHSRNYEKKALFLYVYTYN